MLDRIANGRTDLIFDLIAQGRAATTKHDGATLAQWCAYYGDVSGLRFLLANGARLSELGDNLDLGAAAFHGHWQLAQFLIEQGANPNHADADTGETALHAALSKDWPRLHWVVEVLLKAGANPNAATVPDRETGAFMRDCYTKGETPLHRAAAFAAPETIQLLLDYGADKEARDARGETPLSWASWYARPNTVLRKLLYGPHQIHPANQSMEANLLGKLL